MSEQLKKYRIISGTQPKDVEETIQVFVEDGYKVHSFSTPQNEEGAYFYEVLMSLSTDSKYDNIESLRDVEPSEVDGLLKQGWIVAESWAKNVRMVKKSG
jgi:hypothetical protein